jgi:hypothetical protein
VAAGFIGFIGFEITWRADVYSDAPQASSAASFGTLGITFRARKPRDEQGWLDASSEASVCTLAPADAEPIPATPDQLSELSDERPRTCRQP